MIYLILTQDTKYIDRPSIRLTVHGKVKNFHIVCYVETKEEADQYCRMGGRNLGFSENRFISYKLRKSGEKE